MRRGGDGLTDSESVADGITDAQPVADRFTESVSHTYWDGAQSNRKRQYFQ
jgi:hypothetical protein